MIIFSYIEPIFEPISNDQNWLLDPSSLGQAFSRPPMAMSNPWASRRPPMIEQRQEYHGHIPAVEYDNRYLQFFGLPQFRPEEIEIKINVENRQIVITGKHERLSDSDFETCQFTKRILVPNNVNLKQMKCVIADNGLMQIEGPINQPVDQISKPQTLEREIPIEFVNQPKSVDASNKETTKGTTEDKIIPIVCDVMEAALKKNIQVTQQPRSIPIEIIGLPNMPSPPQAPVLETIMAPKHVKQLQQQSMPIDRPMVREIPIRMVKRPVDQGILCPCCNGCGSTNNNVCSPAHMAGHHQQVDKKTPKHPQQPIEVPIKIDYQPKNAPANKKAEGPSKNSPAPQPEPAPEYIVEDLGMDY